MSLICVIFNFQSSCRMKSDIISVNLLPSFIRCYSNITAAAGSSAGKTRPWWYFIIRHVWEPLNWCASLIFRLSFFLQVFYALVSYFSSRSPMMSSSCGERRLFWTAMRRESRPSMSDGSRTEREWQRTAECTCSPTAPFTFQR